MKITEIALRYKTTVYVFILLIIMVGINSYRVLPLESAPDIEIPIILVQTIYPGVAPEDMEQLVTNVIERKLQDLRDVKKMTSSSAESVSVVTIEFETGVDMEDAYQKVRDKVDQAKPDLPNEAEDPFLMEITVSDFPMMLINVSADYGPIKLKKTAEILEEQIETIPGVLGVDLTGGLEREIQIFIDPGKLEYYQIGVSQVIRRIQEEHLNMPAGNITLGGTKYAVRIPGEYKDVSLMSDIVLKSPQGKSIKISDVGYVVDGYKERMTLSRADGVECVTLRVKRRTGENIVDIADQIKAMLIKTAPTLPAGTEYVIRNDESTMIRDQVNNLENSIISGLLLVLLVLLFSLGIRNALFVAIAIPLSMLITFTVLRMLDVTLNIVVLFALLLALGMLVDNSIVVIENIFRHTSEGKSRSRAALEATKEVAWPIIASTATTVVVFAPLLFWPGIMGDFMKYLPMTVIFALLASLLVAMVINPVITATFLKSSEEQLFDVSGEAKGGVLKNYQKTLNWSLDHPKLLLLFSVLFMVVTVYIYVLFGAGIEFFPTTTPERAQAIIRAPQGTDFSITDEMVKSVEAITMAEDNTKVTIGNVGLGGGELFIGESEGNSHLGVVDLEFLDYKERKHSTWDTIKNIRKKLATLVGAEYRIDVQKIGPPTGPPVSVEISGPNYEVLYRYAREVKKILTTIPGIVDIKDDYEGAKPEIQVIVDREKAKKRKLSTMVISQTIRTAINGTEASVLRVGDEEFDIVVRFDKNYRNSIQDFLDLKITGGDDVQIPLRDVAQIKTTGGMGSIKHISRKRTILVSGDVVDRSSSEVMVDVARIVQEKVTLPMGYQLNFTGESEEEEDARVFLSEAFSIGIMLILMILITQFNSIMRPLIILASVIMSLNGVLIGLTLTQTKFGVMMTGMGIISLAGVVVNNAIVLIDYINLLRERYKLPLRDALLRAGLVRFRPVMLTAITTILGMLPLALGISIDFINMSIDMGSPNVEWWGPMAQAVIFGLAFATVLTLILVPVMYLSQENLAAWGMTIINDLKQSLLKAQKKKKSHQEGGTENE